MFRWLPKNVSTYGGDIDSIIYLIYYIVSGWFAVTGGAIIYFLIRYRRCPGLISYSEDFWEGES